MFIPLMISLESGDMSKSIYKVCVLQKIDKYSDTS